MLTDFRAIIGCSQRRTHILSLLIILLLTLTGCSDDKDEKGANNAPDASTPDVTGDVHPGDTPSPGDTQPGDVVSLPGLTAPVKVQLDPHGVLHISCKTDADCYTAQGYFHADARFFEMDLIRRQTRGELSQLIGSAGLSNDKQFRRLNTTADGTPLEDAYWEATGESAKEMLEAYARGVNAWLNDMREGKNGARLTSDYSEPLIEGTEIRDWDPRDTIALYLLLGSQLAETASEDLFRGEMAARLSAETLTDLFSIKPGIESNIMEASGVARTNGMRTRAPKSHDLPSLRLIQLRLQPVADLMAQARAELNQAESLIFGPRDGQDGSNNWALAPSRTKNGKALLSNDPHLSLNSPAIWHFVELDSKTEGNGNLHVVGASIPAVPGVIIGHNEHISWGVTTARIDLADAYIEELSADGKNVIYNGNQVPIIEKEFEIKIKGGGSEKVTFEYVPHHGPIIAKDLANKRAISMRWVLQQPGNDLDFIQNLMTSENTEEAMASLAPVRAINQNWVIADREGNIGWNPKVAIPNRPWASSELPNWMPLPGDGSAEWQGFVSDEDSPKLYNPPAGFIATANNDFDGSYTDGDPTNDGHTPWQAPPAMGHRHKRIVDLIEAGGNNHTLETMRDIQADTLILHAEVLVPHLLAAANANTARLSDGAKDVVNALAAWEYTCPTGLDGHDPKQAGKSADPVATRESIGCSAFHVLLPYLTWAIFDDEVNENPPPGASRNLDVLANWASFQAALLYIFDAPDELHNGTAYFDDIRTTDKVETKEDIVIAQLDTAAIKLNELFAAATRTPAADITPDDWRWGRIHTVTFVSFVSMGDFHLDSIGPFSNDGGYLSVDVANPVGSAGKFSHPHGASLRVNFEVGADGIQGNFQLPGGQSHHRDSEFFDNLIPDWLDNNPRKLLYDRAEVDAAAVQTIEVQPAQ